MGCKRADIKTGYLCNNNCYFCAQAHNKVHGNRKTEEILEDLDKSRKNGCNEVVFTGGEVTIRKDLIEIIEYAKKSGYQRIQLQTNARMLSSIGLCKKLIAAGANEFSPALHGHVADLHDFLTRSPGSFTQTVSAIKNLKSLGQYVITNTVVVKPNFRYAPLIARLLVEQKVDQFQFAFMHAVGNGSKNFRKMMPWASLAAPYIKKGLQLGIDNNIKVMAEAMPFCLMDGYIEHCSERFIPDTELHEVGRFVSDYAVLRKTEGKTKFDFCRKCEYNNCCEGPWREYPEKLGHDEFSPVSLAR